MFSRNVICLGLLILLVLMQSSCAQRPAPETVAPIAIRVGGSSSMSSLMEELTDAYCQQHPNVVFHIEASNSHEGLEAAKEGTTDIALVTRELADSELSDPQTGAPLLAATTIAMDHLTVIANTANPVDSISWAELQMVYTGERWYWSDLGGPSVEIEVITREEGSGTLDVFLQNVLQGKSLTPRAIVVPSEEGVSNYVEGHPWSVGFVSSSCKCDTSKPLSINGATPDMQSAKSESDPLSRPFVFVTAIQPSAETEDFLRFVRSREGREIIRQRGIVPQ